MKNFQIMTIAVSVSLLIALMYFTAGCGSDKESSDKIVPDSTTKESPESQTLGSDTSPASIAEPLSQPAGTLNQIFECSDDIEGGVAEAEGILYIPCEDTLYAIDMASGEEKWRFFSGLRLQATPVIEDGTVFIAGNSYPSDDKQFLVYAVDAASGTERWRSSEVSDTYGLEVSGATVYTAGFASTRALNAATGEPRWALSHGSYDIVVVEKPNLILSVDSDNVGPNRSATTLYAVDGASGQDIWRRDFGGAPGTLDFDEGIVYLQTWGEYSPDERLELPPALTAMDVNTGTDIWRADIGEPGPKIGGGIVVSPFEKVNKNISLLHLRIEYDGPGSPDDSEFKDLFTERTATLFVLNSATGEQRGTYEVPLAATPSIAHLLDFSQGYAYVLKPAVSSEEGGEITLNYTLSAVSLENGSESWNVPITESPRELSISGVFSDRIFFVSGRNTVWALS